MDSLTAEPMRRYGQHTCDPDPVVVVAIEGRPALRHSACRTAAWVCCGVPFTDPCPVTIRQSGFALGGKLTPVERALIAANICEVGWANRNEPGLGQHLL